MTREQKIEALKYTLRLIQGLKLLDGGAFRAAATQVLSDVIAIAEEHPRALLPD